MARTRRAYARSKIMQADGALEMKLKAQVEVQKSMGRCIQQVHRSDSSHDPDRWQHCTERSPLILWI